MRNVLGKIVCFFIFILSTFFSYGQGCSDAGFCTMGAMSPGQPFTKKRNLKLRALDINQYVGLSRFNDYINVTNFELNLSAFKDVNLQVKAPYFFVNGPLGSNNGLGDLSLSATKPIIKRKKYNVGFTIGAKVPTNKADTKRGNAHLPMYYQTSLGTFDFVTGVSLTTKGWLFATGYQQVVYNINENQFFWSPWKEFGLFEEAKQYNASIDLERGKDVMFRIEKNFNYSKFNFYIGVLDVWRLNRDKISLPANEEVIFVGAKSGASSKGHAITLLAGFGYNLTVKSSLKLMFGQRLLRRKVNPDGLSREQVFSLGYQYKF